MSSFFRRDPDIDELRDELTDYYGTATPFYPAAMMDVSRVEEMDAEEVLEEAERLGLLDDE